MGLGLLRSTIRNSVLDDTQDGGADAITKVNRLINRLGNQFSLLTNWAFNRSEVSFNILASDSLWKYSGSGYIPATFKKVLSSQLVDSNNGVHELNEVSLTKSAMWDLPSENTGRPDEFVIAKTTDDYWEIRFNRQPDDTYTINLFIDKQWADISDDTTEMLITKEYQDTFTHLVTMGRLKQQGDIEGYMAYKNE